MTTIFSGQLTSSGFVRKPLVDIKAEIDALYQAAYGADADLDARSPDGQISGGLAEMFDDLNSIAEDTVLGLVNPNGATGVMLSGLMTLTGCPRHASTYSTAPATFTGTPGTVIAVTKTVQSTEDATTWSPTTEITIGGGGTATGTLRCTTAGRPASGRVPAATLTTIQTPVTGWTGVTNTVGTPGYDVELDPNARIRRQQSVAVASQGMSDSLQAALINILHILDAVVWENDTSASVVIGESGNVIAKNSILVYVRTDGDASVDPAQTTDSTDPVANKIYLLKGHGCGTQGIVYKAPLDSVGVAHLIKYNLATALDVDVKVKVAKRYGWPADGARQIENLITDWAAGSNAVTGKPNIKISGDDKGSLSWTDVLAAFVGQVPGFDFTSLAFSIDGGSTWTTGQDSLPVPFGSFVQISSVTVEDS